MSVERSVNGQGSPAGPGARLVVVHERFTELGGSEQVASHLAALSPTSRVFAPVVDPAHLPPGLVDRRISASPLQALYRRSGRYAHLLPLLPLAMASADLSDADVVITSHHAFANRVRVPPDVPHISYVHSPARWIWDPAKRRGEAGGRSGAAALAAFAALNRGPDREAASRVDVLVANSRAVARRIRRWWGRSSTIIHPPVDTGFYTPAPIERDDAFLVAGRLVPYKRVDVAIQAANRLGRRLLIAGDGRARPSLEALAGPTVEFLGPVSDVELRQLYRTCSALLFPGEEDFGIVPVEAQACGAPVIAAAAGGAIETVVDGVSGRLVDRRGSDPVHALARAMARHDPSAYQTDAVRASAERFAATRFADRFHRLLREQVSRWPAPSPVPIEVGIGR